MNKITPADLERIKEEQSAVTRLREGSNESGLRQLMLCAGTACVSTRSLEVKEAIAEQLKKHGLEEKVSIVLTGCNGFCAVGPVMTVLPDWTFYHSLTKDNVSKIIEEHLINGNVVKELLFHPPEGKEPQARLHDIDFFSNQTLVALRNRGVVDPERIDDYIARNGYFPLVKALTTMTPQEVIDTFKKVGPARPWRRRISYRVEMGTLQKGIRQSQICHL